MRIIIKTNDSDVAFAVVDLTRALRLKIKERRQELTLAKKSNPELLSMSFWDHSCEYHSDAELGDALDMQVQQMLVYEDGVTWTAMPKHVDVVIGTERIPYVTFDEGD